MPVLISGGNLERHSRTIHRKEKDFECQFCSKRYTTKHSLVTHVANIHASALLSGRNQESAPRKPRATAATTTSISATTSSSSSKKNRPPKKVKKNFFYFEFYFIVLPEIRTLTRLQASKQCTDRQTCNRLSRSLGIKFCFVRVYVDR